MARKKKTVLREDIFSPTEKKESSSQTKLFKASKDFVIVVAYGQTYRYKEGLIYSLDNIFCSYPIVQRYIEEGYFKEVK